MVNEPVLILPLFQTFLADLHPEMLQNLLLVMLVNYLAWRKKFPDEKCPHSQKR
jgi:hypothetical protein